jgi:hypothetical protein
MRRRPEHRWPRARRRAQSSAAHVRGRLILSMSRPVLFFPPHCASLFHPHLVTLLFNHHQSYHRAPPSTWVAAAPSVVAVALGHPRPLHVALPQASAAAESRWSTQAATVATKDASPSPITSSHGPAPAPRPWVSPRLHAALRTASRASHRLAWGGTNEPPHWAATTVDWPVRWVSCPCFPLNRFIAPPSCPRCRCPTVPRCPSPGIRPATVAPAIAPWLSAPSFHLWVASPAGLGLANWGPMWTVWFFYFPKV